MPSVPSLGLDPWASVDSDSAGGWLGWEKGRRVGALRGKGRDSGRCGGCSVWEEMEARHLGTKSPLSPKWS